jgi:hypothetical protein
MRTKEDYENYGRRLARNGSKLPDMKEGSWQQVAFKKGHDAEVARQANAGQRVSELKEAGFRGGPNIQNMPRALYHNASTGVISSRPQSDISKLRVVDVDQLLQDTDWPHATREHVRLLAKQHNVEGYLPRRSRLHRSLLRLTMRHQGIRRLTGLQCLGIVPMVPRPTLA